MQALTITHSPLGKNKQPLKLSVPDPENAAGEKLQQYIIDSLSWKMPSLVPFTFSNASTIELAKNVQYTAIKHQHRKKINT